MFDWTVGVKDLLAVGGALSGAWMVSLTAVRTINGRFAKATQDSDKRFAEVAVTMARIDERVKNVESDTARAHVRIDELARR